MGLENPPKCHRLVDGIRTKCEHWRHFRILDSIVPSRSQPEIPEDDCLEAAVDEAIAACGGDSRAAIRALIVANNFLEDEVSELMKAVSHAYVRGRFQTYSG